MTIINYKRPVLFYSLAYLWYRLFFHITAGYFNEIFATHPDSKIIQTILLLILASFLVLKEKDFFFKREFTV
jgi:amino acid permease